MSTLTDGWGRLHGGGNLGEDRAPISSRPKKSDRNTLTENYRQAPLPQKEKKPRKRKDNGKRLQRRVEGKRK